jgi:hypothetical protein
VKSKQFCLTFRPSEEEPQNAGIVSELATIRPESSDSARGAPMNGETRVCRMYELPVICTGRLFLVR